MLLLLSGFDAHTGVVPDELLAAWGFESNPNTTYLSAFCMGSAPTLAAEYQAIRANKKNQNLNAPRLRFTLGKLVYPSVKAAEHAAAAINNPTQSTSKHAKMCDIRQAFSLDHVVYFVHTDVGIFRPEIRGIIAKLQQHLQ